MQEIQKLYLKSRQSTERFSLSLFQIVIQFYEERLSWHSSSQDEDE